MCVCVCVPAVLVWRRSDTGSPCLHRGTMEEEPGCRTDPKHTVLPGPPLSSTWSLSEDTHIYRRVSVSVSVYSTCVCVCVTVITVTHLRELKRCFIHKLPLRPDSGPRPDLSVNQSEHRNTVYLLQVTR